ncbi:uncharacterized protein P884DRAFT_278851 [Thermothelomyces heterothallicus CBS 202.75]|uniref:uncharacterized protein n=1 Tax=Thermothelomyces heterothallicus CBS 202.75 TaxID=1149848 RepID=UPI00374319DA
MAQQIRTILSLDKIKQEEKPLFLRPRIDSTLHRTVPESGGGGRDIIKKADVPRRRNAGLHGNEVRPPCSSGEQDVMRWKFQTFPNKKFQTGLVGSAGPGPEQEAGAKADPTLPTAGQCERTGKPCWQRRGPTRARGEELGAFRRLGHRQRCGERDDEQIGGSFGSIVSAAW